MINGWIMEGSIVAYNEPQPPNFFFIFFPFQSSSSASLFISILNKIQKITKFHSYFCETPKQIPENIAKQNQNIQSVKKNIKTKTLLHLHP
jgi:hypothetical protein